MGLTNERCSTAVDELAAAVQELRQRTFDLVADLDDTQLIGPKLPIVNPLRWEIGHVAWFQEKWVLRHAGRRAPLWPAGDSLYDSEAIPHDTRWDLPLPSRAATLDYLSRIRDLVLARLARGGLSADEVYFVRLAIFHEAMHSEAFTYTRQTLAYPPPRFSERPPGRASERPAARRSAPLDSGALAVDSGALAGDGGALAVDGGPLAGDAAVPGGTFLLGASPDLPFVFDNEKWAHPVEIAPFAIARAPVTQSDFAVFVGDGGYRRRQLWSAEGWRWREEVAAEHPVYWRRSPGGDWLRRDFDRWTALEPHRPVLHVNWYEALAYCRWAGRRLPTEAEWELAAAGEPAAPGGRLGERKRLFPWGDDPPTAERANLDWRALGCLDVGALPAGDSAFGCRQMIGNVWEWTATDFGPYPGFVPDPYRGYSEPWFGTHKVLRGGCWATRSLLLRNTWRNFYTPDRRDVWAGFRTCAR